MNLETHINPELWSAISGTYKAGNYSHAILDAMHYLSDVLREKSGAEGDGASLVGQALGGDAPKLRVNKLQTETERNIQKGLVQILMGMYMAVRNPRSHEQIVDNQTTADAIIHFVDYLVGILAESQEPFTLTSFLAKVFDADFVEDDRYAELLVEEVPNKKRLDVLIEIYREKYQGQGTKLKYIVKALLANLTEDQVNVFLSVVSDDLSSTHDDSNIRLILQILTPDLWPKIRETARLRIENKLLSYFKEGEINSGGIINSQGALVTWARRFFGHFTLRARLADIFLEKLSDEDIDDRRYISEYFLSSLHNVFHDEYKAIRCVRLVSNAIRKDDNVIRTGLINSINNLPSAWQDQFVEKLKDLTDEDSPELYLMDGRPFLNSSPITNGNVSDIPF